MLFPLFKAKVSCAAEVLATKYLSQRVHTHTVVYFPLIPFLSCIQHQTCVNCCVCKKGLKTITWGPGFMFLIAT